MCDISTFAFKLESILDYFTLERQNLFDNFTPYFVNAIMFINRNKETLFIATFYNHKKKIYDRSYGLLQNLSTRFFVSDYIKVFIL